MKKRNLLIALTLIISCLLGISACRGEKPVNPRPPYIDPMESQTLPEVPHTRFAQTKELHWLEAGEYSVGDATLPAGEYYLETYDPVLKARFTVFETTADGNRQVVKQGDFRNFCFLQLEEGEQILLEFARILPAEKVPPIQPQNGVYPEGVYRIGKDLPNGEYVFTYTGGGKAGSVDILMDHTGSDVDNWRRNTLAIEFIYNRLYLLVNEGRYLYVSDATFCPKEQTLPLPAPENGRYEAGMYLVGKDIPPGRYKIAVNEEQEDGEGYYAIYRDASFQKAKKVTERFFRISRTVSLEEGQYFQVSFAWFEKNRMN